MATQLVATGNQAPGFYGLNLQQSSTVLDPQWASEANNAVIGADGRVSARKGFTVTDTIGSTGTIRQLHEYIDTDGNSDLIATVDNKVYKADSPYTTFVDITNSMTITADNWQIVNFNSKTYFFQDGQTPLVYDGSSLTLLSSEASFGDSADSVIATIKPSCVHSAFGRLWVGDGSKIWWSDSLAGQIWNSGTAGALALDTVLTGGTDTVVAISSFQEFIVIFLKRGILIYSGVTNDPASNLVLVEHIRGIGCIARDSIQNIGTDLIFLSDSGVRSLMRTIQEDNTPLRDLSKNARDYLKLFSFSETASNIKSVYSPYEGFYLLSFPTFDKVFCFDLRAPLQDGASRVTTWDSITPDAMVALNSGALYFARDYDVGQYYGYTDDGVSYTFTYATPWLDYGQEFSIKILKNFFILAEAGNEQDVTLQWAVDYQETYSSAARVTEVTNIAEYNIGEFNIAEYSYGFAITTMQGPLTKSGKVVKMKITVPVSNKFDLKKYEIYAKIGRIV